MKSKLTSFFLLYLLVSTLLNAQYKKFDISKYKLPDIRTSSLDLNLNLYHSIQSDKIDLGQLTESNSSSHNYSGLLNVQLNHFRNSAKYQGTHRISVSFEPNFSRSTENDITSKDNDTRISVYLYSSNRFYSNSLFFFEVAPSFSYNFDNSLISNSSQYEKIKQNNLTFSAPISIGYGRIEPVEDARLAIYILDELSKCGRIINPPSDAEILKLASEISKIKRKRFFDSRIRQIKELQVIDSFLIASGIVSSNDITYFTRLNDQWSYASGPSRSSGFSIQSGFDNGISSYKNNMHYRSSGLDTIEIENKVNEYLVGAFFNIRYSKPLNLYWQSDLSLGISYDYEIIKYPLKGNDYNEDYNFNYLLPYIDYSLRLLPNSRTSISFTLGGYFRYSWGERKGYDIFSDSMIDGHFKDTYLHPYSEINVNYYISPQLRLQAYWSLYMINSGNKTKYESILDDDIHSHSRFSNSLSVRFIYSFF